MLVPGGLSDLLNPNNQNSNWKKILRFRNKQEKLEKTALVLSFHFDYSLPNFDKIGVTLQYSAEQLSDFKPLLAALFVSIHTFLCQYSTLVQFIQYSSS